jgi:beta-glucosidase-like glycosyl hydrolase/CubicO group peptidase (beta-lactamase class C family)
MRKTTRSSLNTWSRTLLFALLALVFIFGTQECIPQEKPRGPLTEAERWADSVYQTLSEDQRLGQLFMIRAHSNLGDDHIANVERLIKTYQVGSLCFFQGTPEKQAELVNRYQALSNIPLIVAIDGEWGLGMRMKESTLSFPRQLTLGAIQDNQLIYKMGVEVARQMRAVGVHVNFAPTVDVNNNAKNPVIHTRSFGEDRQNVTEKSLQYMKGMQDNGVMACAKHFPGHGDTDVDSHLDLPVINHDLARLDSIELFPFKSMVANGVGSMMIAHLQVPALDSRANRPTSLSRNTITGLLKEKIGFTGLIFTDALEMKGVTKHFGNGQVEAEALAAGVDILCLPESVEAAMREIKKYIADGRLSKVRVEESVKKVLAAKYNLGLTRFTPLPVDSVRREVNSKTATLLKRNLYENAMTLVRNPDNLLPFKKIAKLNIASLSIGATAKTPFQERLDKYAKITHLQSPKEIPANLLGQLKTKDIVIVSLHDLNGSAGKSFGVSQSTKDFIENLRKQTKVVVVNFGTPYILQYFDNVNWVLQAYEEDPLAQDVAAQALFGGIPVKGKLPVTASAKAVYNQGVVVEKPSRLGYNLPENVGLNSETLAKIDTIARQAILAKAAPGMVVLVAKDGQVVYEKAFGSHTYTGNTPVKTTDLYDLASVTKIAATTIAIMKLYDEGKIDIDQTLGFYLPELRGSNKAPLTIRQVMTHRAGLLGWIPFYKQTVVKSRRRAVRPSPKYYRPTKTATFSVPVTEKLFMREDFVNSMWAQIRNSNLRRNNNYRYSDLGFYLLSRVIWKVSGKPIDEYVAEMYYEPLGLRQTLFRPWQEFPLEKMPPTEEDHSFRNQRVRGYVHDMGAAMMGGVSGHAGLFSDATGLAAIMQMLVNEGAYGDQRLLDSLTVQTFTRREANSYRTGLGFDLFKANPNMKIGMPKNASGRTYGHIGFTGVCTWADPVNKVVYVFLANRTYPSTLNFRINKLGIRSRILGVVYEAMDQYVQEPEEKSNLQVDNLYKKPLPTALSSNQVSSTKATIN